MGCQRFKVGARGRGVEVPIKEWLLELLAIAEAAEVQQFR